MADTRRSRRSNTPAAKSGSEQSTPVPTRRADDAEIVDLIAGVRAARINLTADLSAAAGAVDAERLEVARDILDAERAELAAFVAEAKHSLEDHATGAAPRPALAGAGPRRAGRARSRALIALPAIPLVGALAMSAAAAIGAGEHHQHRAASISRPASGSTPTSSLTIVLPSVRPTAADSTLHRLEHVVTHHPRAAQVLAVANDLHAQLTQMIASSTNDPHQLVVVRRLLVLEQRVLEINNAPGSTAALAASRAIAQLLDLVPSAHASSRPSAAPRPTPSQLSPSTHATPPAAATKAPTPSASTPATHHRHASPSSSPRPTKSPKKWPDPLFGPGVFNNFL